MQSTTRHCCFDASLFLMWLIANARFRSGKSSISSVVFHKLPPNETLFLESTARIQKDSMAYDTLFSCHAVMSDNVQKIGLVLGSADYLAESDLLWTSKYGIFPDRSTTSTARILIWMPSSER